MEKIKGKLEAFFETGTEGICWMLNDCTGKGYDSLHSIRKGDLLRIYGPSSKEIIFDARIEYDFETNLEPPGEKNLYPHPRQVIDVYYVHWVQKEFDPSKWLKMFVEEYPAELIRD